MKNENYVILDKDGNFVAHPDKALSVKINNPTEEDYKRFTGAVPAVYTPEPAYNPETQYTTYKWVYSDGKAVKGWEVHETPEEEPEIEQ